MIIAAESEPGEDHCGAIAGGSYRVEINDPNRGGGFFVMWDRASN